MKPILLVFPQYLGRILVSVLLKGRRGEVDKGKGVKHGDGMKFKFGEHRMQYTYDVLLIVH